LFIDTDIFYAYFSPEDWLHLQAKRFLEKVKKRKIKIETSTLVVLELEILIRRKNEKEAKKFWKK
jgi:predicted nucleic acid-binding protein